MLLHRLRVLCKRIHLVGSWSPYVHVYTYMPCSFLTKAPADVKKSFRGEGGTVEEHLVKESPPAFLDEAFPSSVTVDEADGHGMVRKYIATTSAVHVCVHVCTHHVYVHEDCYEGLLLCEG